MDITIMFVGMLVVISFTMMCLALVGLVNSYTAAMIAMIGIRVLNYSNGTEAILVVLVAYLGGYVGTSLNAYSNGLKCELNHDCSRYIGNNRQIARGILVEFLIFVVILWFPLGRLSFSGTEIPVLVSVGIFSVVSGRVGKKAVLVFPILIGMIFVLKNVLGVVDVIPMMIAGGIVSSILMGSNSAEMHSHTECLKNLSTGKTIKQVILAFLTTLMIPGISSPFVFSVTIKEQPGEDELTYWSAAAVEGWVIQQVLRGGGSGKTMVGDLLQNHLLSDTPLPFEACAIILSLLTIMLVVSGVHVRNLLGRFAATRSMEHLFALVVIAMFSFSIGLVLVIGLSIFFATYMKHEGTPMIQALPLTFLIKSKQEIVNSLTGLN